MKYLIRPLSKKMYTHLREARSIELSKTCRNILRVEDFDGTLPGLYNRGLIDVKMIIVDGKQIVGVEITKSGIRLLERYQKDKNRLGSEYNIN